MDFNHTEDRRMLQDTISRFLRDTYDIHTRNKAAESDEGFSRAAWGQFAELGMIGALFSEEDGGFGGKGFDIAVVFEELGRAIVVEPFLSTAILSGTVLSEAGNASQKAMIEQIIAGETLLALAHYEPGSRYELSTIETKAEKKGAGYVLTGEKSLVLNGDSADHLIVTARVSGAATDEAGLALFLVDPKAAGVTLRGYPTVDGCHAAEISLKGVEVGADALIGEAGKAFPVIEKAIGKGVLALCAESLGAMQVCKETTLEHLRTRQQFGRVIGSFQALQHRMAEMLIEIEQARSAVINAAYAFDKDRLTREKSLASCKNLIGRVGQLVAEEAIQMHGGIGVTWELAMPHFAKRVIMIDHQLGDTDHHLERFIALSRVA